MIEDVVRALRELVGQTLALEQGELRMQVVIDEVALRVGIRTPRS